MLLIHQAYSCSNYLLSTYQVDTIVDRIGKGMGACGIYIHVGLADNKQMDPLRVYRKGIQTVEVALAGKWVKATQRWGGICSFK